ncbi:MAG: PAS domain S-box protein, partial [Dehalococcoidales bacterium]
MADEVKMELFTILIVDDDADQAQNLQDIFEAEGYSTRLAPDGQGALALGKEKTFGLGLIDIGLPDISGVELIERLAGTSPEMEYIIITGHASLQTAVQAVGLKNIIAYETKPPNVDYLLAIVRQVTERKRAEETLKESELFNAILLNNSPFAQVVLNPDTSIKYVNPSFEKLTGYSLDEVRGLKTPHPWTRQEVADEAAKKTKEMMDSRVEGLEALLRKKNGELFWVEVTATPVFENGKLSYILANWVNITQRKQIEDQLRHSQVLTSLGQMTAGIAHEVGNPLASIVLFSEVAMKGDDVSRQTKKDL